MSYVFLWELQEIDRRVESLEKESKSFPLLKSFQQQKKNWEQLAQNFVQEKEFLDKTKKSLRRKEMKLQSLFAEIESLREELYGGKIVNVKELSQMEKKLKIKEQEKIELEDEILKEMDVLEQKEAAYQKMSQELKLREKELAEMKKNIRQKFAEIKREQEELENKRAMIVANLDERLLRKYNEIYRKFNGKGVARATDSGICSGCRIALSARITEKLRSSSQEVRCESCGRLLVIKETN